MHISVTLVYIFVPDKPTNGKTGNVDSVYVEKLKTILESYLRKPNAKYEEIPLVAEQEFKWKVAIEVENIVQDKDGGLAYDLKDNKNSKITLEGDSGSSKKDAKQLAARKVLSLLEPLLCLKGIAEASEYVNLGKVKEGLAGINGKLVGMKVCHLGGEKYRGFVSIEMKCVCQGNTEFATAKLAKGSSAAQAIKLLGLATSGSRPMDVLYSHCGRKGLSKPKYFYLSSESGIKEVVVAKCLETKETIMVSGDVSDSRLSAIESACKVIISEIFSPLDLCNSMGGGATADTAVANSAAQAAASTLSATKFKQNENENCVVPKGTLTSAVNHVGKMNEFFQKKPDKPKEEYDDKDENGSKKFACKLTFNYSFKLKSDRSYGTAIEAQSILAKEILQVMYPNVTISKKASAIVTLQKESAKLGESNVLKFEDIKIGKGFQSSAKMSCCVTGAWLDSKKAAKQDAAQELMNKIGRFSDV